MMLLALLFSFGRANAQKPEWNDPNSLPIWMTPEEEGRRHEIGKNFLKSAALTGEVRNVAEFERMEGVLVRYPLGLPTSFIAAMSKHTVVYTLVSSTTYENSARSAYQSAGATMTNCKFIRAATDSYWTRDYGPWYVMNENNQMCIVDFPYDRPRANDDAVNGIVGTYLNIPVYNMPVVHTGGNYMTDGWGISASTDLVYEENSNNVTWVNQQMNAFLGIDTYHVTTDPLGDYIKHIDCWGKFLDVDKVLITQVPTTNANYAKYEQVASYFASQTSAYGTPYQVFRVYSPSGQPYTNSLIVNDRVYVPIKSSPASSTDNAALEVYRQAMPGYTVTGIYYSSWVSTDALHCRAIGMADRQMLYIKHQPLTGIKAFQPEFAVTADIVPLSGQTLKSDSLFLIYKTNVRNWDTLQLVSTGGTQYGAMLPVNPGETSVSYYLFAVDLAGKRENHPLIGRPDPHTFTVNQPEIVAAFTASTTTALRGEPITFTDLSSGGDITGWSWDFGEGATPATANTQGPHPVSYTTTGNKTVTLTVNGLFTAVKANYISIVEPVTGITVTPSAAALVAGETYQLTATITPEEATNKAITWSTSNSGVATVNQNGLVTAAGSGSALITAVTGDGGFSSSALVQVTVPVTGVSLSPATASLEPGQSVQLNATVSPSGASNQSVTWSSSNSEVATVDQTGKVTALAEGSALVTATTADGGFTATCQVNAAFVIPVTTVLVTPASAILDPGNTLQLTATVLPENATNKGVTWITSSSAVATVNQNGLVTATGAGSAIISVLTTDGNYSASCAVEVTAPACVYETINSQNFDSGMGIWVDGGTDCARSTYYPNSGRYSLLLRDNTTTSLTTTGTLNLSAYSEITVSFSYYPYSFDNSSEDFWLQISTNGGTTFTTVEEWNLNDEFVNRSRYNDAVVIPGPFTSTVKLRFRCDASADDDQVYIDDVVISGCKNSVIPSVLKTGGEDLVSGPEGRQDLRELRFTVYPNPARNKISLLASELPEKPFRVSLFTPAGQLLKQEVLEGALNHTVDLNGIAPGLVILRIETDKEVISEPVIILGQ